MKRLLVIGLCFGLAGCAGGVNLPAIPGTAPINTTTTGGTVSSTAQKIQSYTRLACNFVPTISTIANILSGGSAMPFTAIAQGICDAVTTAPLADGGPRQAKYNGVVIRGKFVK